MNKAFASSGDIGEKKISFTEIGSNLYAFTAEGDPNSGVIVGGVGASGPGVQGFVGRFTVVEDLTIPDGYLLGYATGGAFSPGNPVRMRQHSNASARGLRLNPGRNDYPLQDSFYDGYVGAGIANRAAAVVMFEDTGAGGVYVDPTF